MGKLWDVRKDILDVKATHWHDDFTSFKQGVKDLEIMMQNIIISAFTTATSMETHVQYLYIFYNLAKREAVRRVVEKKAVDIWSIFFKELNAVKVEFESHKKTPEIFRFHPDYSGAANWAKNLHRKISHTWHILSETTFLGQQHFMEEARDQYAPLVAAFDEYCTKCHNDWVGTLPVGLESRLNCALMLRRSDGTLELCFDKDIMKLAAEAQYWQKLGFDIPYYIQEIYNKKEELRILRESTLLVVRDYNSILGNLQPEDLKLFKERIKFLDRKVNPGLTTLTWASKGITDFFVKECRKYAHDVQRTVTNFVESTNRIKKICKNVADTLLCNIEPKRIYTTTEFGLTQQEHISGIKDKMRTAHEDIKQILLSIYEVFRSDSKDVQARWAIYVQKIDSMIENAVRSAVKRTLLELSKAINGEGKNRDSAAEVQPLFKVDIILDNQKIECNPSLQNLEETVVSLARDLIQSASVMTRMTESLKLAEVIDKPVPRIYDIISNEEDILKVLVVIQNGMTNNATKCQAYIHNWDTYRDIWEQNKDAYIRRFAKQKRPAQDYDSEINHYGEQANNIQKEETYTNLNFIRLDCSPLKAGLVSHCVVWQNKLTTLLNTNAKAELEELYSTFREKSIKLKTEPQQLEQLAELIALEAQLQTNLVTYEAQFAPMQKQYEILEKYDVAVTQREKEDLEALPSVWAEFKHTLEQATNALIDYKSKFKMIVQGNVEDFGRETRASREEFLNAGPFSASIAPKKALESIADYQKQIVRLAEKERNLRKGLTMFQIEQNPSKEIEMTASNLESLTQIWEMNTEWNDIWNKSKDVQFSSIDITALEDSLAKLAKKISKFPSDNSGWEVYIKMKEKITQMRKVLPVITLLRGDALRSRHWSILQEETGKPIDPRASDFTLEAVVDLGLDQIAEKVTDISNSAAQELSIEVSIGDVERIWETTNMEILPYKAGRGYWKIGVIDPIFELLEDHQVTISSMKASKFFAAFNDQIIAWEKAFSLLVEVMEILLLVQRQWMYLENIFIGADDIRKQLPKESAIFDSVNGQWIANMSAIQKDPNVMRVSFIGSSLLDPSHHIIRQLASPDF